MNRTIFCKKKKKKKKKKGLKVLKRGKTDMRQVGVKYCTDMLIEYCDCATYVQVGIAVSFAPVNVIG